MADKVRVQQLNDTEYELRVGRGDRPCLAAYPPRLRRWSADPDFPCHPSSPRSFDTPTENGGTATPEKYPRRVLHYELLAPLGNGGQAKVFLAENNTLGHLVALKEYENSGTDQPSGPAEEEWDGPTNRQLRIQREVAAAQLPGHASLVRIQSAGCSSNLTLLELEFVPGPSLSIYARRETLLPAEGMLPGSSSGPLGAGGWR